MEAAVVLPFTKELAALTAEDFVREILVRQLQVRAVVVGENFHFGYKQYGNVKLLREMGMREVIVAVRYPVRRWKEKLFYVADPATGERGRCGGCRKQLLGRPFELTGEVVSGTVAMGRKLGFSSTESEGSSELPERGVYITRTVLEGEASSHRSVTNIGVRPTFNGSGLSVETHLLDYSGNFTPERIEVRFWKRLRAEKKFTGPAALQEQIAKDIGAANKFFARLRRARERGMRFEN